MLPIIWRFPTSGPATSASVGMPCDIAVGIRAVLRFLRTPGIGCLSLGSASSLDVAAPQELGQPVKSMRWAGRLLDSGRFAVTGKESDRGASRRPHCVRSHEPPYMHDGSLATLDEVIEFYDRGGNPNPTLTLSCTL